MIDRWTQEIVSLRSIYECDPNNSGSNEVMQLMGYKKQLSRKPDTNTIPPWMAQRRAKEFLESSGDIPDDFGIPDFIAPAQWQAMHERDCAYEDTAERRIAWKFFARCISDCVSLKASYKSPKAFAKAQAQTLRYIDETKAWVNAKSGEFVYEFSYWCDVLGFDENWARERFNKFLHKANTWVTMGSQLPENIAMTLKEIMTSYKPRRRAELPEDNEAVKPMESIAGWCADCVHRADAHDDDGNCSWEHCPCRGFLEPTESIPAEVSSA